MTRTHRYKILACLALATLLLVGSLGLAFSARSTSADSLIQNLGLESDTACGTRTTKVSLKGNQGYVVFTLDNGTHKIHKALPCPDYPGRRYVCIRHPGYGTPQPAWSIRWADWA